MIYRPMQIYLRMQIGAYECHLQRDELRCQMLQKHWQNPDSGAGDQSKCFFIYILYTTYIALVAQ